MRGCTQGLRRVGQVLALVLALAAAPVLHAQTEPTITLFPTTTTVVMSGSVSVTVKLCSFEAGNNMLDESTFTVTANWVDVTSSFTITDGFPKDCGFKGDVSDEVFRVAQGTITVDQTTGPVFINASAYSYGSYYYNDGRSFYPPAPRRLVSVVAEQGNVTVAPSAARTERYTVTNLGNATASYSLATVGCATVSSGSCTPSHASLTNLAVGASATVTVSYTAKASVGSSGGLQLRATNTIDAGIRDSSWTNVTVGTLPAVGLHLFGNAPGRGDYLQRDACVTMALTGNAASECGDLRVVHGVVGVRTLGSARAPVLLYNSQHARPRPLIQADLRMSTGVALPTNGTTSIVRLDTSATCGSQSSPGTAWAVAGDIRRVTVPFSGCPLTTGMMKYRLQFSSSTQNHTSMSVSDTGRLYVVNRSGSRFGAGWWLAGLEQLRILSSTELLWIGGDGSVRRYKKSGSVWKVPTTYAVRDSIMASGSNYVRLTAEHARVFYNSAGRHDSTVNVRRHATRFTYAGSTDSLLKITVPVASGGPAVEFQFVYETGYLKQIVSPGNRITRLYRTGVRVDSIQDPDGSRIRYRYSTSTGNEYEIDRITDRLGNATTFAYDAARRLTSATRPLSNVLSLQVAESKGLTPTPLDSTFTQLNGPRSDVADIHRFWPNGHGTPTRVRDALGNETTIRHASAWPGLADSVVSPSRLSTVASYNSRALPVTVKVLHPFGSTADTAITAYQWHPALNQPTSVRTRTVGASYLVDSVFFNADSTVAWQQRGVADTLTRVRFTYTAGERLPATYVQPGSATTSFTYDARGNLRKQVSPLGFVSLVMNDSLGRPITNYAPRGTGTTATDSAQVVQHGVRTTTAYDVMNRDTLSVTVGPRVVLSTGRIVPADTIRVRKVLDAAGRPTTHERYYSRNLDTASSALNQLDASRWRYDALGRVDSTTEAGKSGWTTFAYDPAGNVTSYTTPRGHTINAAYDAANRITRRIVPQVNYAASYCEWYAVYCTYTFPTQEGSSLCIGVDTMRYEYDVTGGMRVADNNWARIRRVFLPNGQVKRETQVIRTYETQAPNLCGGGDRHAAAYAQYSADWAQHSYILDYTYDLAGRRTTLKVPTQLDPCAGVCTQSYFYGALGHLDSLWHPSATGSSLTTRFTYDAQGRPVSTTWPGGGSVTLGYDVEGRITSRVGAGGLPTNDTLSYDATGRVLSGTVANPVGGSPFQPAMEYNGLGALQRAVSLASGLTSEEYKTDALGSQLWVRDADMIDGINRTRLQQFAASTSGQLESIELGTYASGSCPQYSQSCHPSWYQYGFGQDFDASGNVISTWEIDTKGSSSETADPQPTESRSYYAADERLTYFNRMHGWIIVTGQGSGTFDEYRYDALGRRVLARTRRPGSCPTPCDAFIERTVYDGDQVLAEIRSSGAAGTSTAYMEAEGGVSQTGTTPGWSNPGVPWLYGIVLYAHGPGLDQPAHIAKYRPDSGWVTLTPQLNWRGAYGYGVLASGTVCTTGSPGRCPSSWPGFSEGAYGSELGVDPPSYASWYGSLVRGRRDASGLTYLRNRYYDPATGQFTQLDPIGLAGGLNGYGFAGGDPINFSDPFGLCAQSSGGDTTSVEVCEAVADIPMNFLKLKHQWFRVGGLEAGLGQEGGGVPGEGEYELRNNSPFFTQTEITDHAGRGNQPGATCRVVNLQSSCVRNALQIGEQRGAWTPTNQCWTFVSTVMKSCALPPPSAPQDATRVSPPGETE